MGRLGRPRTGSAWKRPNSNQLDIAVTLRERDSKGRGKRWIARCPPRPDGVPLDLAHAKAVAAELQRRYDAGTWSPPANDDKPVADPGAPVLVLQHMRAWVKAQTYSSADDDVGDVERYIAPSPIADVPVSLIRPYHILDFIEWMKQRPSMRGGTLSSRTIRNVYSIVRRALDEAVIREVLASNPCAVLRNKLPHIVDKVPGAREAWKLTRNEIERLISDERIPLARRLVYALLFLTGCRPGEFSALRFRDWDRTMKPLGRITITRSINYKTRKVKATKTNAHKQVPVHPTLARLLAEWRLGGWAKTFGRPPSDDDLIVPTAEMLPRKADKITRMLKRDCRVLGIPEHFAYAARHSFISLAQDDGADGQVLRWVTHAPPRTSFDGYTKIAWTRLCEELVKLKIELREPSQVVVITAAAAVPE